MGGADSEVGDATTDVIVESAIFDPVSIRRTAQRLRAPVRGELSGSRRARSSASRGSAPTARPSCSPSGRAASWPRVASTRRPTSRIAPRVTFRPARVNRLLGTELPADEQRELLARVGIETEPAADGAQVVVALRPDPLIVPAGSSPAVDRARPDLAARHRDRGRRRRGDRPRPRLRARAVRGARHRAAALPRRRRSRSGSWSATRSRAPVSPRS